MVRLVVAGLTFLPALGLGADRAGLVSEALPLRGRSPATQDSATPNSAAQDSATQSPADAKREPRFVELAPAETGVDFVQPIDIRHPLKFLYIGGYASPGVAIGDLNGDGLQDLFVTGGPVRNRLYLQVPAADGSAGMHFRDATEEAGVDGGNAWGSGAAMVDIDNDGDLDLYVCNYDSPNALYLNESRVGEPLRLVESAEAFGLNLVDASFMPAFCDYDLDGDLDLLVTGYQYVDPAGRPAKPPVVEKNGQYYVKEEFRKYYGIVRGTGGKPLFTNVGREDYLLQNNAAQAKSGPIRFTNVTRKAGLEGLGVGNSALWWDFDQDGLPDLYIANDFKVPDQLYRNNGNGTFTDVIRQAFPHTTWFSMGSEAGDVNNDGLIDLLTSDMAGTTHYRSKVTMGDMSVNTEFMKTAEPRQYMRNALLINTGTPRFLEAAFQAGVASSDWTWAAKLADLDNDGWLDVFFTNGAARMFNHSDHKLSEKDRIGKTEWDIWEAMEPRREENLAFRNRGDLQFENVSQAWGLGKRGMSYSAAYGDLDNDGDLDLVVANLEEPLSIFENRSAEHHRLRVRLVGRRSNRSGIGAFARIETNSGQQVRQMTPMMGFVSCNEPVLHFGLGNDTEVKRLTIEWPSGARQTFEDLAADQLYTITEPEAAARPAAPAPQPQTPPQFTASRNFPALRHVETAFDDFARQPLLPYQHSQLGPGLALSDVDGDGDDDYYLGRAKGARRAVYINNGPGRVGVTSLEAFRGDNEREDLGSLFFDADLDGDQDLYVVSGSVECEPGDPTLQDRLYLNNGRGEFAKAPDDALPAMRDSGSQVCAADYDRDGDLDLFVGGRVVPGQYPVTPASHLLRNESTPGKPAFVDASDEVAPGLAATGLVTSAVWSDADGDGWVDLMVAHEWGPVKYYRNEPAGEGAGAADKASARQLVDRTAETGLGEKLGWWNGIAGRDLDLDGDIDYVVTNQGLNTTYHASDEKPELLYYGDFDGTGKPQLVEAKFEKDKCFPRRGYSCSSTAMPFLKDKVQSYHRFGISTLQDIYTSPKLDASLRLMANTLEAGVWVNTGPRSSDGLPQFRFQPLPSLAQLAPTFGVVISDFDADGWPDCFLAQNFFSPQLETGRMDSGLAVLLRGRGPTADGGIQLDAVWPRESGILIPGDAKAVGTSDINRDGWPDLLVTVNNGPIEAYECRPDARNRLLRVKLQGRAGNLDASGATVAVRFENSATPVQRAEVQSGAGYLSQSSPELAFGCGAEARPTAVEVRWPNGSTSQHLIPRDRWQLTISQPE
jgi:hypothetical protein